MPLVELWDDAGPVVAAEIRDLVADDIRDLLRAGPVRFVVANLGAPIRWIPAGECYRFWKAEVQPWVADRIGADLDNYPGGYCYFASEWAVGDGPPVVLLAVAH